MPDVLVRNLSEEALVTLRKRASRHRRSLQRELVTILESAAEEARSPTASEVADRIRERLARTGRQFRESAPMIREDRER